MGGSAGEAAAMKSTPLRQLSRCIDSVAAPPMWAEEQAAAWDKLAAARSVLAQAQVDWNMRSLRLAAGALAAAEQEHTALLLGREGWQEERIAVVEAERAGLQAGAATAAATEQHLPNP